MVSKEIIHPEIGKVTFRKSERAKLVSISIKPFVGVVITLPRWISYLEGERVLSKRLGWIKHNLKKIVEIEKERSFSFSNGDLVTKNHKIFFIYNDEKKISASINESEVKVSIPKQLTTENKGVQEFIKSVIAEALRIEAKKYLPNRMKELAKLHGFTFKKLTIKNIKSRWGSCSSVNNINLSLHLIKLPSELIDYVILHELVHTKVKNHSSKFWSELEKIYPNSRKFDKELKKYGNFVY